MKTLRYRLDEAVELAQRNGWQVSLSTEWLVVLWHRNTKRAVILAGIAGRLRRGTI